METKGKKVQFLAASELSSNSRLLAPTAASKAKLREKVQVLSPRKPSSWTTEEIRRLIENNEPLPEGLNGKQLQKFVNSLQVLTWINRAKNKLQLRGYDEVRDKLFRTIEEEALYDNPNDRRVITFINEGEKVSILKQVNVEMYTDSAIKERKALTMDDEIIFNIHLWWLGIKKNANGKIEKDTYIKLCTLIYDLLVPDGNEFHREQITEDDWNRDAEGNDEMDELQFAQSLFQMADLWSMTYKQTEYVHFLSKMHAMVSKIAVEDKHWDIMEIFNPEEYVYEDFLKHLHEDIPVEDVNPNKKFKKAKYEVVKEKKKSDYKRRASKFVPVNNSIIEEDLDIQEEVVEIDDPESEVMFNDEYHDQKDGIMEVLVSEVEEEVASEKVESEKVNEPIIDNIEEEMISEHSIIPQKEEPIKKVWRSKILDEFEDIPDLQERIRREKEQYEMLKVWRKEREASLQALRELEAERIRKLQEKGENPSVDEQLNDIQSEIRKIEEEIKELQILRKKKQELLDELQSKGMHPPSLNNKDDIDKIPSEAISIPSYETINQFRSSTDEEVPYSNVKLMDGVPVDRSRFLRSKDAPFNKKSPRLRFPMKTVVANEFLENSMQIADSRKMDIDRISRDRFLLKQLRERIPLLQSQTPSVVKVGVVSTNVSKFPDNVHGRIIDRQSDSNVFMDLNQTSLNISTNASNTSNSISNSIDSSPNTNTTEGAKSFQSVKNNVIVSKSFEFPGFIPDRGQKRENTFVKYEGSADLPYPTHNEIDYTKPLKKRANDDQAIISKSVIDGSSLSIPQTRARTKSFNSGTQDNSSNIPYATAGLSTLNFSKNTSMFQQLPTESGCVVTSQNSIVNKQNSVPLSMHPNLTITSGNSFNMLSPVNMHSHGLQIQTSRPTWNFGLKVKGKKFTSTVTSPMM